MSDAGSTPPADPDDPPRVAPRELKITAVLAAIEGVGLVGGGVFWAVRSLVDTPDDFAASIAGALFAALAGLVVLRIARGIWRVEGWSRTPLVVLQILLLPVGYSLLDVGEQPLLGIPIMALGVVVLYLLFTPAGRLAFLHR